MPGKRYFIPWTQFGAAGRWLCYACLMTHGESTPNGRSNECVLPGQPGQAEADRACLAWPRPVRLARRRGSVGYVDHKPAGRAEREDALARLPLKTQSPGDEALEVADGAGLR